MPCDVIFSVAQKLNTIRFIYALTQAPGVVLCCGTVAKERDVLSGHRNREKVRQKSHDAQCTRCGLRGRGWQSFRTAPNSGNGSFYYNGEVPGK